MPAVVEWVPLPDVTRERYKEQQALVQLSVYSCKALEVCLYLVLFRSLRAAMSHITLQGADGRSPKRVAPVTLQSEFRVVRDRSSIGSSRKMV